MLSNAGPSEPGRGRSWVLNLLTPAVWAVRLYRIAHGLYRYGIPGLPEVIGCLARVITGVEIHHKAQIGRRFKLYHGCGTVIGETAIIGEGCVLFHGVTLGLASVDDWRPGERLHPKLGDRVRVYAGAKLVGPISVGDGATIGANAVVVTDVPAGAVAVGVPARIVSHP
jgi:serine O-acetyltransferase